jgi:hypothetical protein
MGDLAGVPIEPDSQTRLLDASQSQCVGVVGSGVPGGPFPPLVVSCSNEADDG